MELIMSAVGAVKENPVYLIMLVPIGFLAAFVSISISDAIRKAKATRSQETKQ